MQTARQPGPPSPYRKQGILHDGFLVSELVKRDFKARYDRSILGMFWCVLQPTLTMGLLYAVFSLFFKSAIPNFPLYLISGIVFYQFFVETTSTAMRSIQENAALIAKVRVPLWTYPVTRAVSSLVNFLFALIPLFAVVLLTRTPLRATALLLLYLLRCAARGEQPVGPDALGLGFTLFVLACVLSMLYTTDFGDSLRILVLFLGAFLLCWLIAVSFDTPQALRRLLGFLYLCLLAVSFMGIMQRALGLVQINRLYTDLSINKGVPARIDATLDNPNNLSAFLQFFLPLGAAFAGGADKSWKRVLLGLGLLIPAVALVMTYSRAGWIAVMLSAAVFVWCCNKRLIPALVILAILALPLLPQSVLTRLSTIFDARDTSRNHRLYIWGGVSDLLRDRGYWLTGIGLGPKTFQNIYPAYAHQFGEGGTYQSQMLYMELDLEMGILGFLSFLWMTLKYMGRAGRGLARSDRATRLVLIAALAGFVALFVSGTVEYQWFYQRIIYAYFIFFGIAIAAVRTAERGTAPCAA